MLRKLNDKFQENFSRPGIIDARARSRAATWQLRNTDLKHLPKDQPNTAHSSASRELMFVCSKILNFKGSSEISTEQDGSNWKFCDCSRGYAVIISAGNLSNQIIE